MTLPTHLRVQTSEFNRTILKFVIPSECNESRDLRTDFTW